MSYIKNNIKYMKISYFTNCVLIEGHNIVKDEVIKMLYCVKTYKTHNTKSIWEYYDYIHRN